MRFLFYAVAAMTYLEYMLYLRGAVIWENRHLPSVSADLMERVHPEYIMDAGTDSI